MQEKDQVIGRAQVEEMLAFKNTAITETERNQIQSGRLK